MHCYNNYDLAFAIATFPLPVLSGIGHSTNLTVSEMVSYYNGITPTDLAYYFLKIMEDLDESICTLQDKIALSTRSVFENRLVALIHSSEIVYRTINQCFQMETLRLNTFDKLLQSKTKHSIEIKNMRLSNLQQFLPIWIENNISFVKQQLIESSKDLSSCINDKLKQNEQKLDRFALHIQLVDPKNVLKKGYAIVSNSQGVLSTSNSPVKGDKVHVLLQNQEFDARVE
jgi:exodeoxyribonuclease VII large subunit